MPKHQRWSFHIILKLKDTMCRVFSQHFGNMTRPLELGIFASFYTKLGKNTPYNKNKNIKYFVYSTSYSSLTHKQILKSDLQSDLPFVVGAQKNPLIKMVLLSTHNICLLEKYKNICFHSLRACSFCCILLKKLQNPRGGGRISSYVLGLRS